MFRSPPARSAVCYSLATLGQNREKYEGKPVTVVGIVSDVRRRTSYLGSEYLTFRLTDSGYGEECYVLGPVGLANGDRVMVTGWYTFTHQIHVRPDGISNPDNHQSPKAGEARAVNSTAVRSLRRGRRRWVDPVELPVAGRDGGAEPKGLACGYGSPGVRQ